MKRVTLFTIMIAAFFAINFGCGHHPDQSQPASPITKTNNDKMMETNNLESFGKKYAAAWCSQHPDSVAAFFASNGSLSVNKDSPAVGRVAIAKVAQGFMTAFPDMIVAMDSLVTTSGNTAFHWTLAGSNTGSNGTGKKVRISGVEIWQLDKDGLILKSDGSFDAVEYNRQLKEGVND